MSTESDGALLSKFVASGAQDAFEELVKRHGSLVLGVCRRLLGQTQDAEDAAQATFLTLVTKAKSLSGRDSLAGWLYHVALNIAQKARSNSAKRQKKEREAQQMSHKNESDEQSLWAELRGVLDQELNALPEKYRDVILLHHVQGQSLEQTAVALNSNMGTISTWLHRGKEMLKARLTRQGVALSVSALAVMMTKYAAAEEIPAALAQTTLSAADSTLAGTAAASPHVAALTQGALKAMFYAKVKTAAVVLLGVSVLGAGATMAAQQWKAEPPPAAVIKVDETPKTEGKTDIAGPTGEAFTVHKGSFACTDDQLKKVSQLQVSGTFFSNLYVSPRFPCGGTVQLGASTPEVAALPDRLNHEGALVFNGGYFFYAGQGLDAKTFGAQKPALVEQVKQMQFLSGMSEIRIENGNEVSGSTTLLANDAKESVQRNPGATLMVGGSDKRIAKDSVTSVGVNEKLKFSSGLEKHLKGAGGAAGATNRGVIPWITVGSYQQPGVGGVATYDAENGIRALAANEYDKKLEGTPDRNVWTDNCTLGEGKHQTINALVFKPYYGMELGAGSVLTISSGFLQFGGSSLSGPAGPSAIGYHPHKKNWEAVAGAINFGPAEGIIWSNFDSKYGPNIVGCVLQGTGGLTVAGNNTLILIGANTYTGKTSVACGTLQLGEVFPTHAKLGTGDVDIAAGATLKIMHTVSDGIPDSAVITLRNAGDAFFGMMELEAGVNETVSGLVINGKQMAAGTYGGKDSAATNKLEKYFLGAGVLTVNPNAPKKEATGGF